MRPYYGWYVIAVVFVAVTLGFGLGYYNNPVFYPTYIQEFSWSRAMAGSGASVNFIVIGILSPFIGMLADRYSVKKLILAGIIFFGLARISFSLMKTPNDYYVSNILVGAGIACAGVTTMKVLTSRWFRKREGLALGIVLAGTALGGAIGPSAAAYLLSHLHWRAVHLLYSAVLLGIVTPLFWIIARDRPQELGLLPDGLPMRSEAGLNSSSSMTAGETNDIHWIEALKTSPFWLICASVLLFHIVIVSVLHHFVLYLTDLGFTLTSASAALSVLFSARVIGTAGFGILSDRHSKKGLIVFAVFLLALMSLVLSAMTLPALRFLVTIGAPVYVVAALIGFAYGGGIVSIPILTGQCFGISALGRILGLVRVSEAIGGVIGPLVVGLLFDISGTYRVAFLIVSLAAFGALLCLLLVRTNIRVASPARAIKTDSLTKVTVQP